ncbi:IS3 family transposase [Bifidobacterium pullorum]|uniref:IS3 family transposase n=1 Tax=Bifidobacterium pullorum TaxID=78448 RepID=UPI00374411F1
MSNAPLPGYPSSRITSAALCSYRSYNSTARLRCSFEYLAMMTTPPRPRSPTFRHHPGPCSSGHWEERTCEEVIDLAGEYIHWYNHSRIKQSLGWKSPVEYRTSQGLAV